MHEIVLDALLPMDVDAVLTFWRRIEGQGLDDVDRPEPLARYVARNPGVSAAARVDGRLVGVALAGHDGRRGFLHHVAVDPKHRHQGVGRRLVRRCLDALAAEGIEKCHVLVFKENESALEMFGKNGWEPRDELRVLSTAVSSV